MSTNNNEIFKHPILAALCSIRINGNLILYVNREDAEKRLNESKDR